MDRRSLARQAVLAFGDNFATVSVPADPRRSRAEIGPSPAGSDPTQPCFAGRQIVGQGTGGRRLLWIGMQPPGELFSVIARAGSYRSAVASQTAQPGEWCFAAAVIDAGKLGIYLNGKLLDRSVPLGVLPAVEDQPLLIGKVAQPEPQNAFTGVIDELVILRRGLGAGEVSQWYEAGKPE